MDEMNGPSVLGSFASSVRTDDRVGRDGAATEHGFDGELLRPVSTKFMTYLSPSFGRTELPLGPGMSSTRGLRRRPPRDCRHVARAYLHVDKPSRTGRVDSGDVVTFRCSWRARESELERSGCRHLGQLVERLRQRRADPAAVEAAGSDRDVAR